MLILSRKKNQSIMIGDNIELTVISIEGDQIKIGIDAPRSVEIHRKEIFLAIQDENTKAARGSVDLLKQLMGNFPKSEDVM